MPAETTRNSESTASTNMYDKKNRHNIFWKNIEFNEGKSRRHQLISTMFELEIFTNINLKQKMSRVQKVI
nr:hypothetical protein [Mycoplasmopsis bovis]